MSDGLYCCSKPEHTEKWNAGYCPACCFELKNEGIGKDDEIERLQARIDRLEKALKEIEHASGGDSDPNAQHYCWIRDTAREALSDGD